MPSHSNALQFTNKISIDKDSTVVEKHLALPTWVLSDCQMKGHLIEYNFLCKFDDDYVSGFSLFTAKITPQVSR